MLRSLYAGVSGMKTFQTKLDVIGNNIANVSTTAFKSSRARFQDMLSQSSNMAMAPATNQGGTNSSQVGLGVQLAGVDTITKQGMMQPTSRTLDNAIDGDGYYIVAKGPVNFGNAATVNQAAGNHQISLGTSGLDPMFTRDGAFTLDSDGNLLTSDGYRVLGYGIGDGTTTDGIQGNGSINFVDASKTLHADDGSLKTLRIPDSVYDAANNVNVKIKTFSIDKEGVITAVLDDGRVSALGQIAMATFKNPAGLDKLGKDLYQKTNNSGVEILRAGTGTAATNEDNSKGFGDNLNGMLEMSNVDLAEQFTEMITTSRGFQANSKVISTGDEILQDILNIKR